MKGLLTFTFLLLMMSCASQKTDVTYEAMTRGSSKKLIVVGNQLSYATNQKQKIVTISSENLKKLNEIISKITLEEMKDLEAPTKERLHDGALHATVTVKQGGKEYISSTFDDGHPPAELKPLVDLLMSFIKE
ncbi:hypothetical protein C7447_101192 [Tenacibaculum adriaticum]|uniref:Lipoprotein n=1 Tax=Tenacibaculum adriaticum TaxID=413713 RepID=A0A5S5DXR3_9FLAO|nr:hypothetical protein [Tenacibaculum adriaticum]TYP99592.1 hypothetical protein C7447_101192 [Tenacibaculum adriaticum]